MRKAISKLIYSLAALMLLFVSMLLCTANSANTAKAANIIVTSGWSASFENGIGTLTYCDLDEETVIVPTTIGGANEISGIGNYCITRKTKMKTLIISEGITDIETFGVIDDPALTTVYFPKSVTNFDRLLFTGCDNLKYIYYGGTMQEWQDLMVKTYIDFFQTEAFVNSTVYYECGMPVSGFKASAGNTSVTLSWTKNPSADGYIIEQLSNGEWKQIKTVYYNTMTSYIVPSLTPGTGYSFRISSFSYVNGTRITSSPVTLNTATTTSAATGFKVIGRAADALRLSWDKISSSDGYLIERKSGSSWVTVKKITTPSTAELRIEKLSPSTAYTFRIRAYNNVNGAVQYGAAASLTTYTNPSIMSGLKVKGRAADALRLSWNKNTTADGYIIERKSGSSWVRIKKITDKNTLEYRISGLSSAATYTFRIQAYKMQGKTAYYGNTKSITATTDPSAVSGFAVSSKSGDTINLKWNRLSTVGGYIIEQKSGSTWKRIAKLTSNSTVNYSVYKLKANTSYSFRIKTYIMSGTTALYSGYKTLSVKTAASGVSTPNTVTGLKLKGRAFNALRLGWDKNPNAQGYIIDQKSGSTWKRIAKLTSASTCEYRISSLKAGTSYSFRIKAYKTSGKNSYYSSYVNISATTNPSAVTGFKAVSNTETTIKLGWDKNTSAQGYIIELQSGANWKQLGKITKNSTISCSVTGLKPNTKYTLRIRTYLVSGSTTLYSSYVTITAPTKTDPTAVNGFSGYSSFDIPTIPSDDWGAGNTKYKGSNDDFFLSAKYDGTKTAKVTVSVIYNNLSHSYTHVIGIYLNERDHIDFALPSGMVNDGTVLNAGIIDGSWGIRTLGADRFTSKDADNIEVCSLTAVHVDWTGLTPSIFYFQFKNDQNDPDLFEHQYEGVIAVELGFNINNPPRPKCIRCEGTGRCIGCNGTGRFLNEVCTWCFGGHGSGRCDKCQGTGTVVKPTDTGVCDNIYIP